MNPRGARGLPGVERAPSCLCTALTDRREEAPLITRGLFALALINFPPDRAAKALAEGGDKYLPPKAMRAHAAGAGITELAPVWAAAWQMGPGTAYLVRLIKTRRFETLLSLVVRPPSHHPSGRLVIC